MIQYELLQDVVTPHATIKAGTISKTFGKDHYFSSEKGTQHYSDYMCENTSNWFRKVEPKGEYGDGWIQQQRHADPFIDSTIGIIEHGSYMIKKILASKKEFSEKPKLYSEKELLEAEQKAFEAARSVNTPLIITGKFDFLNFSDFKNKVL